MILVVDNYDSFTYNLVQYLGELGAQLEVRRNDQITLDEIASMAAVIGASVGGLKSMTATSGPGFSLMQELIGYGCIAEIPMVIVNVMRFGPSTGLPTAPSQGDANKLVRCIQRANGNVKRIERCARKY